MPDSQKPDPPGYSFGFQPEGGVVRWLADRITTERDLREEERPTRPNVIINSFTPHEGGQTEIRIYFQGDLGSWVTAILSHRRFSVVTKERSSELLRYSPEEEGFVPIVGDADDTARKLAGMLNIDLTDVKPVPRLGDNQPDATEHTSAP